MCADKTAEHCGSSSFACFSRVCWEFSSHFCSLGLAGEIECCPLCAAEISAMFACEHGMACPADVPLTCPVGLDPFLDGLCTAIEAGQATEVAAMENWLAANGHALAARCSAETMDEMHENMACGDPLDYNSDRIAGTDDLLALLAGFAAPTLYVVWGDDGASST